MRPNRSVVVLRTWLASVLLLLWGAAPGQAGDSFAQAQKLMQEGRDKEAFVQLLAVPGAEYLAVRLARPHAEEYLAVLQARAGQTPSASARLIEGDLLLALGRKEEALRCYRQVVARIGTKAEEGWVQGFVPADEYPVEPPASDRGYESSPFSPPVPAFAAGPGSHRDNWLIRRFIALQAWDDASREYARIWDIHRRNTQPYVLVARAVSAQENAAAPVKWLITPAGFDGKALQFAIDYAYFLKRRGELNEALGILLEPLLIMDMDRNPNSIHQERLTQDDSRYPERTSQVAFRRAAFSWGMSAGISRKEYLRLTYGEFQSQGKTDRLFQTVQDQIARGDNRARRVLARLRMHGGRPDEALALELAYIEHGGYEPLTAAYRRAGAYEDAGKLRESAREYEKALSLPYSAPVLPEAEEEVVESRGMSAAASMPPGLESPPGQTALQQQILARLQRLYAALGEPDRALELTLRQLEVNESLLESFEVVDQMAKRLRAAGQESRLKVWSTKRVAEVRSPTGRANLYWVLGDTENAAAAVAAAVAQRTDEPVRAYLTDPWKERFRQAGPEPYHLLLRALVEANPKDAQTRLEWLEAAGVQEGPEVIHSLELLLDPNAAPAFTRGMGAVNRTRFNSYFELAYRLLRLYERTPENEDKLRALGFRILEGQRPFQRADNLLRDYRANWNLSSIGGGLLPQDILNCLYVFLSHLKEPQDIERAATLAQKSGSIPLVNQVNHLRVKKGISRLDPATGHRVEYETVAVRTLGLPEGVRLLTNRDDVRAIAPASVGSEGWPRQVWIGTSWGLVRYQTTEPPARRLAILQIPLATGVTLFCQTPAGLYAGTRNGLYRLDDPNGDNPVPVRVCVETADEERRAPVPKPVERLGQMREERLRESFNVTQLLWWQDALWIRADGAVYRYQPDRKETQYYGRQEGGLFVGLGRLWGRTSVLDLVAGEFQALDPGVARWGLIGATSREIWADVWVDDALRHRPALLDPQTLKLRVLPITDTRRSGQLQNDEFSVLGEFEGQIWLAGENPYGVFVYDREKGELRFREGPLPSPQTWAFPQWLRQALAAVKLDLSGDRGPRYCGVPATGDRLLVGNAIVREWAEDNLGFDDNDGMSHHVQDLEGGLFEIDPAAVTWRKVGSPKEELSDFYVKKLVRDGERLYVCTNGGVTILPWPDGAILGRLTVSDGLPSNKVEDVARIGDKLYLACELGDEGGGLAVRDLKTGLIRVLTVADGLRCNKIKGLRVEGTRLHILYGTIYAVRAHNTPPAGSVVAPIAEEVLRRWRDTRPDERVRTFKSSILDTQTGRLEEGNEILPAAYRPEVTAEPLPILGGLALCAAGEGGPRFLGGTHGLLVCAGAMGQDSLRLHWPEESVQVVHSARQTQVSEAAKIAIPQRLSPEQLQRFVTDANPYVVADALAATLLPILDGRTGYAPIIGVCVTHPCDCVRTTAVYLLSQIRDNAVIEPLRTALQDANASIRAMAALALARRGHAPDIGYFEEIFRRKDTYGDIPFGAASRMNAGVSDNAAYEALARDATGAVFALLMKYPPNIQAYDNAAKVFPLLGEALRKHLEAADILLHAADNRPGDDSSKAFAWHVFRCAGKEMLPILCRALTSNDRVIRSNAARACGAIGDPSSVPALIAALDLESGLSRASIVWALGELKAKEAMPHLARLYVDAANDERRRQGSGFRAAQSQAVLQAQFDSLSNLDAVGADWNELKEATLPPPVDPQENEQLLTPAVILEAVSQIGSEEAQEFYRILAGLKDVAARSEAAIHLAEGGPGDKQKNLTILRNLLADNGETVRIHAAVSLLILGEDTVQAPILEWLRSTSMSEKHLLLRDLGRVQDTSQLAFAREQIAALASDSFQPQSIRDLAHALAGRGRTPPGTEGRRGTRPRRVRPSSQTP